MAENNEKEFLGQRVAGYLLSSRNQIGMMAFVAVFALLFVNIFRPYDLPATMGTTNFMYFVWSLVLVVFGIIVLIVSRLCMSLYARKHDITQLNYFVWVFLELFVLSVIYAVCFYCIYVEEHDFMTVFLWCALYSTLVLIPPYALAILYLSMRDKTQKLRRMESQLDMAMAQKAATKNIIPFYDERGELQLSVTKENFIYIESADNYVHIWYLKNNLPRKLVMRSTMQRMEEELAGTNVMRCHRSYLVNMDQVKVLRRDKDGFFVELGITGVPDLPVSKTYSEAVLKWLSI
jgi:hypothetical protein